MLIREPLTDIYQTCFPNDRISFKLLVWGVFIWEWVQLGLVTQTYFDIYVYNYGSIASLTSYHSTWFSVPIMSAIVSFAVQCFFAWRIWVLSLSRLLTGIIIFVRHVSSLLPSILLIVCQFSFAQAALEVAGGVIVRCYHSGLHRLRYIIHLQIRLTDANAAHASLNRPIVSVSLTRTPTELYSSARLEQTSLIVATVVDVLIAASMTYLVRPRATSQRGVAVAH